MKAILSIGFRQYLVDDAKKALAFAEFMSKAAIVGPAGYIDPGHVVLSGEEVAVRVETLLPTVKITKAPVKK